MAENDGSAVDMRDPIRRLELTTRAENSLTQAGITTVGQLCSRSANDLLRTPNLGQKCLREIKEVLANLGLSLGMSETITFRWHALGEEFAYVAKAFDSVAARVYRKGHYWIAVVMSADGPVTRVFVDVEAAKKQVEVLGDQGLLKSALSAGALV